eukprot:NODE_11188_length_313_cov_1.715909_g10275_i0.p1 GENE.NODE_11188_length_313_cov_1.715909_g10275_i0~~NODE_11188_length_313_cov_1.715909_g10275_i0.p1  ORF type:complete len:96 (+),score=20.51 NODE_11188_length_313_cov_1.715909_g10275_i0:41-289(+)
MRNWKFEGSDDKLNWTVLRSHEDDCLIRAKKPWALWALSPPSKHYYSFLRLHTTPDRMANQDNSSLVVSSFEVYGNLCKDLN